MPIINNPNRSAPEKKQQPEPGKEQDTQEQPAEPEPSKTKPGPAKKTSPLTAVAIVVSLIGALGGGGYAYVQSQTPVDEGVVAEVTTESTPEATPVNPEELELDIKNYIKLSTLYHLTSQEIEMNTISLIEAQKTGSSVSINAIEVILNHKKKELVDLRDRMADTLESLYTHNMNDGVLVEQELTNTITTLQSEQKQTAADMLIMGMETINSVPPIMAPKEYFKNMIDDRL
ncbi:hypothetical protein [Marinobacter maritimus]|uniref:hypothetical protein n=1 Tax=Marinobacter maritimus TaxID=277961 RepID=UPI0011A27B57|nr:hypothetical protein [Marinobacter maritimus]